MAHFPPAPSDLRVSFPSAIPAMIGALPSAADRAATAALGAAVVSREEPKLSTPSFSSVVPTLHCADTQEWRKRLIRAASQQIILSGNYCGGKAFDEILALIDSRMDRIPTLKVVILGHPEFIQDISKSAESCLNKQWLWQLQLKFPERFLFIECPDTFYAKGKSINHAKLTLIDYGKYVCIGGSGIKDNFAMTGLDDLTVDAYLEEETQALLKLKDVQTARKANKELTGCFRDQDFVFQCHDPAQRKQLYRQALWLANLWHGYHQCDPPSIPAMSADLKEIEGIEYPALNDGLSISLSGTCAAENVLLRMLQEPVPSSSEEDLPILDFASSLRKVDQVQAEFFFTGRFNRQPNPFVKRLIREIAQATKEIVINHMHFLPPPEVLNALIAAVKERGVKLTLITAGVTKNCPSGHLEHGPKNQAYCASLFKSLTTQEQQNLRIYLFEQHKKGLHKKIVLIDDELLFAGSSNMETKCFSEMGDYEVDFVARSPALALEVQKIIQVDIEHSRFISGPSAFPPLPT